MRNEDTEKYEERRNEQEEKNCMMSLSITRYFKAQRIKLLEK